MTDDLPCRWCPIRKRDHGQRWTVEAGCHRWAAPIRAKETAQ